jgi:tRNA A37 threonylcarbamoyladenosine synthetase subunit TsaC/SUA5/YrdC
MTGSAPPKLVTLLPDGSDAWRLDPVIELLREGGVSLVTTGAACRKEKRREGRRRADPEPSRAGSPKQTKTFDNAITPSYKHHHPKVGVIPTDTLPALVVDVAARDAAARLCAAKGGPPKVRTLALLCRGWADVDAFTLGFPAPPPGVPDPFRTARSVLPGPYTLILGAGKALPKAASLAELGRKGGGGGRHRTSGARRSTVGVRLPAHPVARAVLAALDRPLLCTSVRPDAGPNAPGGVYEEDDGEDDEMGGARWGSASRPVGWSPDEGGAALADRLAGRGVVFVVDCPRPPVPDVSTVLDFSGGWPPALVRAGAGDPGVFGVEVEDGVLASS